MAVPGTRPTGQGPVLIRRMAETDADSVRHVERAAFSPGWKLSHGGSERPVRTRANVLTRLGKDPQGCFVAVAEDRIVGLAFSRTWGGVGWCGSLAVQPGWQGQGIGRQLLEASLHYLGADPKRVVGLETGASEVRNVRLYLRAGLRPCPVTLLLGREVRNKPPDRATERWSEADAERRARWHRELRQASSSVVPGLDYGKEIDSADAQALGDTCVLVERGTAFGLCVVTVQSPYEGWGGETATVQALVLHRDHTGVSGLVALLQGAERIAADAGCTRLELVVSTGRRWVVDQLLDQGFEVERLGLQMVVGQGPPLEIDAAGVDCSRWAG